MSWVMILNRQAVNREFNQIKTTKGNGNHMVADQQRMNQNTYHKNKAFIGVVKNIMSLR